MKTKHIFGTVLMAAFTAACSNEDLQLVEQSAQVGGRIELGEVALSLGEVESRFVVGDNFNDMAAELGDKVGAALIDVPNGAGNTTDAKFNYNLTDYISTNYAFEYNGSVWTTPAKMVEGNYMFYAPYNAAHATRQPIVAELDAVQTLVATANGIDELSAIKQMVASGKVMAVSHEFIAASDAANVETALVPIYAYPYITLKNNYKPANAEGTPVATDLVVKQIVIKKADASSFAIKAPFKHFDVAGTAVNAMGGFIEGLKDFSYWNAGAWAWTAVKGDFAKHIGKNAYTSEILGDATATSSAIVVKAPAEGLTLTKNGGEVSFYAVIPAESYGTDALELNIYTNKGVFEHVINKPAISAGKRYPVAEYNAAGTSTITPSETGDAMAGDQYTAVLAGTPVDDITLVTSTEDLVTLVQNASDEEELVVNTLTKDVQITANVMNAIKSKAKGWTVTFATPVTIATTLNSSNKNIVFEGGAEITDGTIAINNMVQFKSALTVKGGTVTLAANFANGSIVNNGGTVTLNSSANVENKAGTLTIGSTSVVGTIVNNGGTVTFTDGTASNDKKIYGVDINNNKGTVTVPVYTVLNGNVNNGNGDSYAATLNINGAATAIEVNATDGTINVAGSAKVETNNNLIVMESSNATATVNTNNQYINNTKNGKVYTVAEEGIIYYEFTSDVNGKLIAKSSVYNTIVLNNVTWTPEADQTISANVELRNATIAVWDSEINITINGKLYAKNSNNKTSKVEGVEGATVAATTFVTAGITNEQGIAQ